MKFLTATFLFVFVIFGSSSAVLHLENKSELREAQAALFNVNSNSGWLLVNYVGPSTVRFIAGGEGGIDEFENHLADDQIQYLLVRASDQNTYQDIFVNWIGPNVGRIEEKKKSAYYADAANFFEPYHKEIKIESRNELVREFS